MVMNDTRKVDVRRQVGGEGERKEGRRGERKIGTGAVRK